VKAVMGMRWSAWRSAERGFLMLIALLVVVVIVMLLYRNQLGGPVGGRQGGPGGPQTLVGGSVDRAQSTLCRNNLAQLRAAIAIYQGNAGSFPPTLEVLRQYNQSLALTCPVGGESYQYDPGAGGVHCVHEGHGAF